MGVEKVLNNKKIYHNYEIKKTYVCGIKLQGSEVKSLKKGNASISQAFCLFINNELFVRGMYIDNPSSGGNLFSHELVHDRKLLLKKKELVKLNLEVKAKGLTLVPINVVKTDTGLLKLTVGLGRGKRNYDKRISLKEKDIKKDEQTHE